MNKSTIAYIIFFLTFFLTEPVMGQDSLFLTGKYKWELGIGINAKDDQANPYSLLLKKHISPRTALRFGLGFNYNRLFEKDVPVIEDYNLSRIFIVYEVDRLEKKWNMALTSGIQKRVSIKNLNFFAALDLVLGYNLHNIELPNGVRYHDVRIPIGSSFTTAKQNKNMSYGFGVRPSMGIQYPFSSRLSITLESSLLYNVTYRISKDFYYILDSDNSGILGVGTVEKIDEKNWNYQLNFRLIPLITINYHFH